MNSKDAVKITDVSDMKAQVSRSDIQKQFKKAAKKPDAYMEEEKPLFNRLCGAVFFWL